MSIISRRAIKAIKVLCIFFIATSVLCSCGRGGSTDLRWQSYPLTVKCGISCDDRGSVCENAEAVIEVTSPYMGDITFISPESICGYSFSLKEDGAFASYDDLTVPLGEEAATDLEALFSLFSLDPEYMSEHTVNKQNGTTVNVAVFSLYLNEENEVDVSVSEPKDESDDDSIGTATVYISAAGELIRIEAEFKNGESLVINVHECEYGTE